MAISYTKNTVTRTNPFDGLQETVVQVTDVVDGSGKLLPNQRYEFPDGTTDPTIDAYVVADLTNLGYPV